MVLLYFAPGWPRYHPSGPRPSGFIHDMRWFELSIVSACKHYWCPTLLEVHDSFWSICTLLKNHFLASAIVYHRPYLSRRNVRCNMVVLSGHHLFAMSCQIFFCSHSASILYFLAYSLAKQLKEILYFGYCFPIRNSLVSTSLQAFDKSSVEILRYCLGPNIRL